MFRHLFYIFIVIALGCTLPAFYFDPWHKKFIFLLGFIGFWRYSWAIHHFVRGWWYAFHKFPKMRAAADALGEAAMPGHIFLLITSFRIGTEVSRKVFRSVISEAIESNIPSTIVASIVEMQEEWLMRHIFELTNPPDHVKLILVRIPGTGKRDGLASGFRAISSTMVDLNDSVVAVIDGDSILTPGSLRACCPFFKLFPQWGALTTDETCEMEGIISNYKIYRQWYRLRFAQRALYMCSHALSNRVLTLTGRMSLFRGNIVGDPEFIDRIEFDTIEHWRLGRFRFLTGDDKSSWYHVLKDGWQIGYVADTVAIHTVEDPPSPRFIVGATTLMHRWFGNMLRTNARARALSSKVIGIYTWWILRDQLISMWTSLFGTFAVILGSFTVGGRLFLAFAFWILLTRYLISLALSLFHRDYSISWPFLLYFNQIHGSLVKIYLLSHLHKQQWTRQKTRLKNGQTRLQYYLTEWGSTIAWSTNMMAFILLIAVLVGLFTLSDLQAYLTMLNRLI